MLQSIAAILAGPEAQSLAGEDVEGESAFDALRLNEFVEASGGGRVQR